MEAKTYFEHYHVCTNEDGSPLKLSRIGDAIAYKAVDIRSGESAALRLIPIESIDPAMREQFEEQARALAALDHVNVARVLAFATENDHFVLLSEFLQGQTVESWVRTHGPMPPDAVLRVALQVVGALGAASFHRLTHRAIQPSNFMIVPGQVIEGGWPFVKLTNFSVAGLTFGLEDEANLSASPEFASPEQLQQGAVDFRSEIYSLGIAMCFMLTGAVHPRNALRKQIRRFPKAMRALLTHMLRENPGERPQDPASLEGEIRECLNKIDRRQMLAQKLGIALPPTLRKVEQPRVGFSRKALALAAIVFALAIAAGVLFPENIKTLLHLNRDDEVIGVPIGVPENSRAPFVKNVSRVAPKAIAPSVTPTASSVAQALPSIAPQPSAPVSTPAIASGSNISSPAPAAANNETASEPSPPATGPDEGLATAKNSSGPPASSIAHSDGESPDSTANQSGSNKDRAASSSDVSSSNSPGKAKPTVATPGRTSTRAHIAEVLPNESEGPAPRFPAGTVRVKYVGLTADGRVRLRLPSGRIVVVTPRADEDGSVPHRYRRDFERREIPPPPTYAPAYPDE
jgi:serine/threonine protein kinase